MKVLVIVNRLLQMTSRQTTAMLIAGLSKRDVELFVGELDGLHVAIADKRRCVRISATVVPVNGVAADEIDSLAAGKPIRVEFGSGDLVVIRTNPGRDETRLDDHQTLLSLLATAESVGVRITNSPGHLFRFAAKTSLFSLDSQHRPAGLVSQSLNAIATFCSERESGCIVKPVLGSRGRGVTKLSSSLPPPERRAVQQLLEAGPVICQDFVDWSEPGDIRLVVLNGEPLEIDGCVAAIHRVPAEGDFRGNLHAGGTARPITPTQEMRDAARHAAALLAEYGIALAGVDLVGDKIIEMNVFSTGGLFDAQRFYQRDFASAIVDSWLQ